MRNAAGYRVRWKGDDKRGWNYRNFKANQHSMRFSSLFGGVTYTIQVRALSRYGQRFNGRYSAPVIHREPYPPPTNTPLPTATSVPSDTPVPTDTPVPPTKKPKDKGNGNGGGECKKSSQSRTETRTEGACTLTRTCTRWTRVSGKCDTNSSDDCTGWAKSCSEISPEPKEEDECRTSDRNSYSESESGVHCPGSGSSATCTRTRTCTMQCCSGNRNRCWNNQCGEYSYSLS